MDKVLLNGIQTYSFSSRKELIDFVRQKKKGLVAVNAEKILHATAITRSIINRNIGYSDGVGAVWALKRKGLSDTIKIPGCELWLDIIRELYREKSFYLIGAKQTVIEQTVKKLKLDFPDINIVNYRNGYFASDSEKQQVIDDVKKTEPDVVFVALGSPKQEFLIQEMQEIHPAIYQGLGGSFDVYTGNVKRAPCWWIKNHLEWAYRLVKQPLRILRQIHLLKFLLLLLFNRF